MNTIEVLVKAKELIQDPANWIQNDYSEQIDGRTCYCSLGAISKVTQVSYWESGANEASQLLYKVVESEILQGHSFAQYNDTHTHAEVMEAFDKAIQLAQAEEV